MKQVKSIIIEQPNKNENVIYRHRTGCFGLGPTVITVYDIGCLGIDTGYIVKHHVFYSLRDVALSSKSFSIGPFQKVWLTRENTQVTLPSVWGGPNLHKIIQHGITAASISVQPEGETLCRPRLSHGGLILSVFITCILLTLIIMILQLL